MKLSVALDMSGVNRPCVHRKLLYIISAWCVHAFIERIVALSPRCSSVCPSVRLGRVCIMIILCCLAGF